jgi:hypothetical protein
VAEASARSCSISGRASIRIRLTAVVMMFTSDARNPQQRLMEKRRLIIGSMITVTETILTAETEAKLRQWLAMPEYKTLVAVIEAKCKSHMIEAINKNMKQEGRTDVGGPDLDKAKEYQKFLEILGELKKSEKLKTVTLN